MLGTKLYSRVEGNNENIGSSLKDWVAKQVEIMKRKLYLTPVLQSCAVDVKVFDFFWGD